MLTHVEFQSAEFPPLETEFEEINPGRYGKRLADFLFEGLKNEGEPVEEPIPEDWGWVIPIENPAFSLWIGVGNYEEYPNGFLCFIEPHKEFVRKLWKKIPTKNRIEELQQRMDRVLGSTEKVHELKWWTHDEFNRTAS